ncbi:MAG: DoxX family protein, partial [Acidobacteria bacterium]|nr:DoxX family protein [Acidobacteriota bacterium]
MCTWLSIRPGMTAAPRASMRRVLGPVCGETSCPTARMRPSWMAMAEAVLRAGLAVYMRAPVITRSAVWACTPTAANRTRMGSMDDSMAQGEAPTSLVEPSLWKTAVGAVAAILLGLLFIVAGVWKITDPFSASVRLTQALVPASLSLPAAILLGIGETFGGVLILVPRFRRWGAWLTGLMLVAFLIYIGVNYHALRGEECNCFPWVKRAVGPAFFVGDLVMLGLA